MRKKERAASLMMALGQVPVPKHLYEDKTPATTIVTQAFTRVHQSGITLSKDDRKKLRINIRAALIAAPHIPNKKLYKQFLADNLMPIRADGELLSINGFSKYVVRCRHDMEAGISDEVIIGFYQSGYNLSEISRATGLSITNVRDRLDCHNLLRARKIGID